MVLKLDNIRNKKIASVVFILWLFVFCPVFLFAQSEGPKPPVVTDYKSDSSYKDFSKLRHHVAYAQIAELKKNGALLVRLKTNKNTIARLKAAGNNDLATQVEKETEVRNKIIMASYKLEFTFCPVYFFFSDVSDSVKHKRLDGIFLDSTLNQNSSIVCNKSFYLIADEGVLYNSSLGLVSEDKAEKAIEKGTPSREVPIVIKNRYFIQLHKPFPYFQIKASYAKELPVPPYLENLYYQINKITDHSRDAKDVIKLRLVVRALNNRFEDFYLKSLTVVNTPNVKPFVY